MTIAENKSKLVEAHRGQDWELAKQLSQERERLKKKKYCTVCGVRINVTPNRNTTLCRMHSTVKRFYSHSLACILLFCFTGCRFPGVDTKNPNYHPVTPPKTNAASPPLPPVPMAAPTLKRAAKASPGATAGQNPVIPFIYPTNAADFRNWNVQTSTDGGLTWVQVGPDYGWNGGPTTNVFEVQATNPGAMFRLRGWNIPVEPWVLEAEAQGTNWIPKNPGE